LQNFLANRSELLFTFFRPVGHERSIDGKHQCIGAKGHVPNRRIVVETPSLPSFFFALIGIEKGKMRADPTQVRATKPTGDAAKLGKKGWALNWG